MRSGVAQGFIVSVLAGFSAAHGAEGTRIGEYLFSIDGKPFHPRIVHLHGEPGRPAPGDVFPYHSFWISLGNEKELHFSKVDDGYRGSHKLTSGGKSRWAAVAQPRFSKLSDEEIRGLLAVHVGTEGEWPGMALEKLDFDRAVVTVSVDLPRGKTGVVPPLPRGIKCLSLDLHVWADRINYRSLADLHQLEFLDLGGFSKGTLDLRILAKASGLRYLNLHGGRPENLAALAGLKELRYLDLSANPELRDIASLGTLENLRELRVLATGVPREDVEAFRRNRPRCEVLLGFDEMIRRDLHGADRVRFEVRDFEAESRGDPREIITTVADSQAVTRLVESIEVERGLPTCSCGCIPYLTMSFFNGETDLAGATYHHGLLAGFSWPGDLNLTESSHEKLVKWLYDHGVKQPFNELEEEKRRVRADQAETVRATNGMSGRHREAFVANKEKRFRAAIAEEVSASDERARLLLRALGAGNGPLGTLQWPALLTYAALRDLPRADLLGWAEDALSSPDRRLRRGAVRFWETAGSILDEPAHDEFEVGALPSVVRIAVGEAADLLEFHDFKDPKKVAAAIVAVEMEARSAEVRDLGLTRLLDWADDFPPEEVRRRLLAALRDPHERVRRRAILVAGELNLREAEPILLDALNGKKIEPQPLPEVPADESESVDDGFLDAGGEAATADLAALALGAMGSERAKPLLQAGAKENDFHRVALAVAGEPERLKPEDFHCSNQARQLAAVEAVVRAKGRVGLEAALDYEQASHWWEADRVAAKLCRMLLENDAPGADSLKAGADLSGLRAWYANYGKEYLARFSGL